MIKEYAFGLANRHHFGDVHEYALMSFTKHQLFSNFINPSDLIKLNITSPNVHTHIYVYMAISLQNTFSLCIFCDGHWRRTNKET